MSYSFGQIKCTFLMGAECQIISLELGFMYYVHVYMYLPGEWCIWNWKMRSTDNWGTSLWFRDNYLHVDLHIHVHILNQQYKFLLIGEVMLFLATRCHSCLTAYGIYMVYMHGIHFLNHVNMNSFHPEARLSQQPLLGALSTQKIKLLT